MTKEETLTYLKAYLDGDTAIGNIIPLRSVLESALEYLEPSLPSNQDEAANDYGVNARFGYPRVMDETDKYIYKAFKAGAEWMAGQFQKIDGSLDDWYETNGVEYCYGIRANESFEVPEGFYIRKK